MLITGRPTNRGDSVQARATVTTTALACLLASAALTGCGGGTGGTAEEKSAGDILDEANATMRKLNSVIVDITNGTTSGGSVTPTS